MEKGTYRKVNNIIEKRAHMNLSIDNADGTMLTASLSIHWRHLKFRPGSRVQKLVVLSAYQ